MVQSDITTDPKVFFDEFGETVVYSPLDGTPRQIKAIVDRDASMLSDGNVAVPRFSVTVANRELSIADDPDSIGGIGSEELDTGGDCLTVARRVGETAEKLTIGELTMADDEMMDMIVG